MESSRCFSLYFSNFNDFEIKRKPIFFSLPKWNVEAEMCSILKILVKLWLLTVTTGCPRMFYTQKCKTLRIFITIKTIEFDRLIYLSERAILLAFWEILNQGNRPNKTENTWHYVKRVIFCILIEMGKEGFMSCSA